MTNKKKIKLAISSSDGFYGSSIIFQNLLRGFGYDGSPRISSAQYVSFYLEQLTLKIYDGGRRCLLNIWIYWQDSYGQCALLIFLWILGWNCTTIYLIAKEGGMLAVICEHKGDQHDVVS